MIGDKDKFALVTGASSGIGFQMAKLLAKDGKNLVVVARKLAQLQKLKKEIESTEGTMVKVIQKNLADPGSPWEIFNQLASENRGR